MSENTNEILLRGLTSKPKYIPAWYRYDEEGSRLNDICIEKSKWYYFHRNEIQLIDSFVQELMDNTDSTIFVDLGSGNAHKTRILLDKLLQTRKTVTYIPVDISEDYLINIANKLRGEYGGKVDVVPMAMEYLEAIEKIRLMEGNKLYIWFGSLQSLPYEEQIRYCKALSDAMQEKDMLLLTIDITSCKLKDVIEKAYLDPEGYGERFILNSIHRLNKEKEGDIDLSQFNTRSVLKVNYSDEGCSGVQVWLEAKENCNFRIESLDLLLNFEKGERLYLHEGDAISCKYTIEQLKLIFQRSTLEIVNIWKNTHVGAFLLKSRSR